MPLSLPSTCTRHFRTWVNKLKSEPQNLNRAQHFTCTNFVPSCCVWQLLPCELQMPLAPVSTFCTSPFLTRTLLFLCLYAVSFWMDQFQCDTVYLQQKVYEGSPKSIELFHWQVSPGSNKPIKWLGTFLTDLVSILHTATAVL